jgi:hypothetical protein
MKAPTPKILMLAVAGLLAAGPAFASTFGDSEVDSKFRAKVMKEKAKMASEQSSQERKNRSATDGFSDAECGSQSIGNVNTNGRPGTGPREVFVFAPNAINIVSGNGCNN